MLFNNDIVLRPRFKFDVDINNEKLLSVFESSKDYQKDFIITRLDDHVFIRFPKNEQHYWSPQLHLEINEKDSKTATVHGLFGPNPTIWTMFMFFHFIVAGLFVAFAIWTYTNLTLNLSYAIQLFLTLFMVILWFVLYLIGRMGKTRGKDEMYTLHNFMKTTILKL